MMSLNLNSKQRKILLDKLWVEQEGKCVWCNGLMDKTTRANTKIKDNTATFEHKVPRSKKGKDNRANIVLSCKRCNQTRGGRVGPPYFGGYGFSRRPYNEFGEQLIGLYFPVLDYGFISLVDYMGTDQCIEKAARVSYRGGTKKTSDTGQLIRYLIRMEHSSPLEMCELKFHMGMPIFVARQIVRHRMACLTKDTKLWFDLPAHNKDSSYKRYSLTIEQIWNKFQPTINKDSKQQRNPYHKRDRVKSMKLRQVNEDTLKIQYTNIENIYNNGVQPIFEITLDNGKTIKCTDNHKFLFSDGWHTLKEATNLELKNHIVYVDKKDVYMYTNGETIVSPLLYKDKEWLNDCYHIKQMMISDIAKQANCSYHCIRKYLTLYKLTDKKRGGFKKGSIPINKGKTYKLGPKALSKNHIENIRKARSGQASNFWRGGISTERANIGRWTTENAHKIHLKYNFTCQLCHSKNGILHAHHIIPVWADITKSRDFDNLITLCKKCHRSIHGKELDYVHLFINSKSVDINKYQVVKQSIKRVSWNKLEYAKLSKIVSIVFKGYEETYDVEVKGPYHNFIANGMVSHNSLNEASARYSVLPDLFYTPTQEHLTKQSKSNKQGRDSTGVTNDEYSDYFNRVDTLRAASSSQYHDLLDKDIARELARMDLPLSTYTYWYWKVDLRNLLHFVKLRADSHAQYETRVYAEKICGMLAGMFPNTFAAFMDYQILSISFTQQEMGILRQIDRERLKEHEIDKLLANHKNLSKGEISEFKNKLIPSKSTNYTLDLSSAKTPEYFRRQIEANTTV